MKSVPIAPAPARFGPLFRVAAAFVLLSFATVGAIRAYCPMPAVATESESADPHGCCKSGLSENTPSCCHSDDPSELSGLAKGGTLIVLPHRSRPLPADVATTGLLAAATAARPVHPSPPTVLRV